MPGKRGNNEGCISKRKDGTYCAVVTIGRNPETGKPKRVFFYGKTRQEAAEKLAKAMSELRMGVFVEPSRLTLGDWLERWLQDYARPHLRPTTFQSYQYLARTHIIPTLGHLVLKDLRPDQIQQLYNAKLTEELSCRTIQLIHVVIHSSLKQACRENLVARNASEATSIPRSQKKERRVLSLEEQERLLDCVKTSRWGTAFLLLMATGLRRGELLALRWSDIDLKEGLITISRGLIEVRARDGQKWRLEFQAPKTPSGRRTIPIPITVLSDLKAYKARQSEERLRKGDKYNDNGLAFATRYGGPVNPRNFERSFQLVVSKAGVGKVNLHALRHTFATRLLEVNEHPKVVQELLGHSNIRTTLDIYSHVSLDLKKQASSKLNKLLFGTKTSSVTQEA